MSRPQVLVTRRLPGVAMERLAERCDVTLWDQVSAMPRERFLQEAQGKQALLTMLTERVDDELLDAAGGQLAIVANYAVGFDNVDVAACSRRGVLVANTPDVLTEATADLAWALLLAAARRVAEGDRFLRSGQGWIWGPEMMLGQQVHGKVLGIVGFGRIGQAAARRAAGFSMGVLCHSRSGPPGRDPAGDPAAEWVALDELLARSDFVSLHVSLNADTRHLIDARRLGMMKPTAVLVNTARGPVVDEVALADALDAGTIFSAGLDVFEREPEVEARLLRHPRVVLMPHLGSATVETRAEMGLLAAQNILAGLDGARPPALVNPEVWDRR